MAPHSQLPCDGDGVCMICKKKPSAEENIPCKTCATPWHLDCLSLRPQTLADTLLWDCPDCDDSLVADHPPSAPIISGGGGGGSSESSDALRAAIWAIESDQSLTAPQKAKRRQQLMSGANGGLSDAQYQNPQEETKNDVHGIIDGSLNCSFCMQLLDRPVTTPCGHNFCLKCFQRWIGQGKRTCANCRNDIPPKMASQPRINSALVIAIRMAKMSKSAPAGGLPKAYHFVHNQDRPEKAYTTERAKKSGKANACSGKIFVTVPPDHFGPILAENDPDRKQGVLVGESWEDSLECRQWGAHLPMISGIAGQSAHGAQSVALSGGYQDDEDHGEWFLYTGSGGRDLSGNKRTNKEQSSDQEFVKYNEALRVSCRKGYPIRVVRSHKEKRSSYAPETGLRYDGIYRIEKCWFKVGVQGFKICRYLFVRCDNHPAPWTSDEHGDRPRPLPVIDELKSATNMTERKADPSWDYDEMKDCWMWKKNPPQSKKRMSSEKEKNGKRTKSEGQARKMSVKDKLLKEFSCLICRKVMVLPLTTPCAHNFCKCCLEGVFAGQSFVRQRTCEGRRTLRTQKNVMKCPSCSNDISDFLKNPQVNRELMGVIESLQRKAEEAEDNQEASSAEESNIVEKLSSAEEGNSMKEKPGTSESLVEETKEVPNHPETKTQQTRKRKKKTSDCKPELGRKRSRASGSQEKTNVVNDDLEVSSVEREVSKKK